MQGLYTESLGSNSMHLVLMAVELTEDCPCWVLVYGLCPSKTQSGQLKYFKDWKKSSGNSLESKVDGPEKKGCSLSIHILQKFAYCSKSWFSVRKKIGINI